MSDFIAADGPARLYPTHEALLTQLGHDYEAEGRLVPVEQLWFLDLYNFYRLLDPARNARLADTVWAMHGHDPDHFARVLSCWRWRDCELPRRIRVWLIGRWGSLDLDAARDWLGATTGLDADLVERLSLAAVLEIAESKDPTGDLANAVSPSAVLSPKSPTSQVKDYLTGWEQILVALGRKDSRKMRDRIRNLNRDLNGPIRNRGRGSRPLVVKEKLLAWWNDLEKQYDDNRAHERDKAATVENQYRYGRQGTEIVPDIEGSVKRRRKDRKM